MYSARALIAVISGADPSSLMSVSASSNCESAICARSFRTLAGNSLLEENEDVSKSMTLAN